MVNFYLLFVQFVQLMYVCINKTQIVMTKAYGILNRERNHIDVSNSLHGAKCYATRNNYKEVSKRVGYNVTKVWSKINNKWTETSVAV